MNEKFDNKEISTRQLALDWWRNLTREQQDNMITIFRNSDDFRKNWSFEMISRSSGTIEAVFLFIESVK